ncbi:hypothetical protein [Dactylosporangium matsuzakiense]|uniref:Uncharacterized protein n=1 Tax=Dactylosporangium matsuzakiense TaxID=53360 RepID=A0A9W6KCP9_9ACTN|nr:hypothetical protein [Dactylosporangium matsuzakiense]UWZ42065.1 hypothetical protein Dmats_31230 [Dactylosporangium matsuzakiense]GLK99685.1 hypothetical protein GCM10017581_014260 [Dactylosporangium matsuzakiense]
MTVLRVARAALLAVATTVVALAQLHLPSERFWEQHHLAQWISVGLLALFIVGEGVASVAVAVQQDRIHEYDNDIRTTLTVALAEVVDVTDARWDEVAIRYYRRRGFWIWRRLILVAALHAVAAVRDTLHSVRLGAGPAGVAVETEEIVSEQWRDFAQSATRQGRNAWEARPVAERYGLSWGELRRSAKPEGLVAYPTFGENGQVDGCIMLSGTLKASELAGEQVLDILDSAATSLDRAGPPPRGWWMSRGR